MATEQISSSEEVPRKRLRRMKQDPQFIFETPTRHNIAVEPVPKLEKPIPTKIIIKTPRVVIDNGVGADLYVPGDVVWSKLGSFPWWPALICHCDAEGGMHTRTFSSSNNVKRQFFVYFYSKSLECAWLSTRSLLKYAGLNNFIQTAEQAVQQATTKSEKVELANRYQLKVSMKNRQQWDEAIEIADHALTLTRDERIKQFYDLLNQTKLARKSKSKTAATRPQASTDKDNKLTSSKTSISEQINVTDNSHEKNYDSAQISNDGHASSSSAAFIHFMSVNIPPLSNFELKQIAEGILNHPNGINLTLDEAHAYAITKAIEIIHENHNYRMNHVSPEWFYDSILLRYPSIVFKYRSWFERVSTDNIPDGSNAIDLKQWQIALMIYAQAKMEQLNDLSNDNEIK